MQKILAVMVLVIGMLSPSVSQAQVLKMATGATLGGLAGSVYVNGVAATTAVVSAAAVTAANAAAVTVTALAGALAAASTPVLIGIVVGGGIGLLLAF
jgi:hypothetical protein